MKKGKAIKELYLTQSIKEKWKIVEECNLIFHGFNNLTKKQLENNEKYFDNQIDKEVNINKITTMAINKKKYEDFSMQSLLSAEKIVEKYSEDFYSLVCIFEEDKYKDKTEQILKELITEVEEISDKMEDEQNSIETLRKIIHDLEVKNENKQIKINELSNSINILNKELIEKKHTFIKIKSENSSIQRENFTLKDDIEKLNIRNEDLQKSLYEIENKYEVIKEKAKSMEVKTELLKDKYLSVIEHYHLIGFTKAFMDKNNNSNLTYYSADALESFLEDFKNRKDNSKFIAYTLGLRAKNIRIIKKYNEIECTEVLSDIEKKIGEVKL